MKDIDYLIPNPTIRQVSGSTRGKPFFKRIWLYFKEPTEFELVGNWLIELPNGMKCLFPDGFRFDGASIPWFLRWLITSFGPILRAAIFHDFGYRYNFLLDWDGNKFSIGRGQKFFDILFREIIVWTSELKTIAFIVWAGVTTFGFKAWNKRRNEQIEIIS